MEGSFQKSEAVNIKNGLVSIIVPTYKEADNLESLITQISTVMSPHDRLYEIIVVDDNSQDGSKEIITKLTKAGYPARIIIRTIIAYFVNST